MTEYRVVLMTCGGEEEARKIAEALVEENLAACVNVVPGATSIYRWEGKVRRDPEVLLIAKTREKRLRDLESRVKDLHSYTVPEVVALPVVAGSKDYLDWVKEVCW
ncbi:MAG: divalent-cation tolerance protein CutA [Candidatus Tectomicrobia bacterium]|nr:divalent-cation tolerance protein CutA [Candidatus Tectomicrobia bacterium]